MKRGMKPGGGGKFGGRTAGGNMGNGGGMGAPCTGGNGACGTTPRPTPAPVIVAPVVDVLVPVAGRAVAAAETGSGREASEDGYRKACRALSSSGSKI